MNLQSLKQRLSLQNISATLQQLMRRFPVTVCLFVLLTLIFTYAINAESLSKPLERLLGTLSYFCSLGIFIDFGFSLWGEELASQKKRRIAEAACFVPWAAYCIWLFYYSELQLTTGFMLGNIAWVTAIALLIPFVSFLRCREDLQAWHFLMAICRALFISGIVTFLMTLGLMGLIYGAASLFELKVSDHLTGTICVVCLILLWGILFLALVPDGEKKHNSSPDMPPFLRNVVSWLLLPLLGCYIVVLYAYGISILVHWELPKGLLSTLVTAVMFGYLLCYTLLYPKVLDRTSWQSRVLSRWLPVIALPLLVLMTVGVARRFTDYGITAQRLYLLTLLIWFYVVCILLIVLPEKRFRWLFLSFGGLFLLTSGHPFHFFRLTRPVIEAKIEKIIADNDMELPISQYALKTNPNLPEKDADELYDALKYMRTYYSSQSVEQWTEVEANDSTEQREKTGSFNYFSISPHPCPQGYTTYQRISIWLDKSSPYPVDSIYDGIVHAPIRIDSTVYVFLLDTAAIRIAGEKREPIIVPTANHRAAVVLEDMALRFYSDQTFVIPRLSGTLFTNPDSLSTR